jgi:signal transduction histidine kinase
VLLGDLKNLQIGDERGVAAKITEAWEGLSKLHIDLSKMHLLQFSGTKFLKFLINNFLDYSRIKNNQFKDVYSPFDTKEAFEEVVSILDYQAKS